MNIKHWDSELKYTLNQILEKFPNGGKVLDLGAGDGLTKNLFPSNWKWEGIDIVPIPPDVKKGDAHNLDFENESFDLIISIAVFEHLHSPWIAIKEISRVLKKGGFFMGTVAFLEPEHGNSYFHMTKRGMSRIINEGNLSEQYIEPVKGWRAPISLKIIPLPGIKLLSRFRSIFLFSLRSFLMHIRISTIGGDRKIRALNYKDEEKYRYSGAFRFLAKK